METSQIVLNNGMTFLATATGIMLIIVGGFIIKLLVDLSRLVKNVDETTSVVKNELRPTLRELNESLHTLNDFMKSTDKGIDKMRYAVEGALGLSTATLSKLKFLSGSLSKGLIKGFSTVMKMFQK
jgi:uncharacterized protein YoxC